MATAGKKQGGGRGTADEELEPRYEWQEDGGSFILRIHLSGFRKEDFRVQVNGSGRLTVRGQRSDAAANARHSRVSKVFQLPSTSDLDNISGRFEAGVLTLTVPKRHHPPPKEEDANKPQQDATATAEQQAPDAKMSGKPEPEQKQAPPPPPPAATEEEGKPNKAGDAAPAPAADTKKKQADTPKPAPPQAEAEKKKSVDPESLAETVKRRAAEDSKAAAERQRKASRGFKERVAEELQGLAASEWAEGLVDTVKNNREVIAAAVAAFSLGVFVSARLCSRSTRN